MAITRRLALGFISAFMPAARAIAKPAEPIAPPAPPRPPDYYTCIVSTGEMYQRSDGTFAKLSSRRY